MTPEELDACDRIAQQIDAEIEGITQHRSRVTATFEFAPGLTSEMIQEIESRYEGAGWNWAAISELSTFGTRSYSIELAR